MKERGLQTGLRSITTAPVYISARGLTGSVGFMNKFDLIRIIEDHGGPNKKLREIMEHSEDYGECFNVKLVKDDIYKKYHGGSGWFVGDGPDYTGSLGFAIEKLYNIELDFDGGLW